MDEINVVSSPRAEVLRIRRPHPDDAPAFLSLYDSVPAPHVGRADHAVEEERARIARHLLDFHGKHGLGLFVVVSNATGEVVGRTGVKRTVAPTAGAWDIDYMLRADCRGRGIGHCIAAWTMQQVRDRWAIDELLGHVALDNTPSIRILERQGFRPIGQCELVDYPETGVLYRYRWTRDNSGASFVRGPGTLYQRRTRELRIMQRGRRLHESRRVTDTRARGNLDVEITDF